MRIEYSPLSGRILTSDTMERSAAVVAVVVTQFVKKLSFFLR